MGDEMYSDGYRAGQGDAAERIAELEAALAHRDTLLREISGEMSDSMQSWWLDMIARIDAELVG